MELARTEFDRKKQLEGGDGVQGQDIPRMPTKAERPIHELCHWPYESWCQSCVASRGKADHHHRLAEGSRRAESKSEFPVVSMDFCFTRGLVEPEGASRRHQTIWWRSTRWSLLGGYRGRGNSVLCLPTPGKGRPHAKIPCRAGCKIHHMASALSSSRQTVNHLHAFCWRSSRSAANDLDSGRFWR